jgi:hypothetical protein
MDHIKEHAKINVSSSYLSKYRSLLLKLFSIVSIDKSDLGRVKHFFHKIHLKDNEPVYNDKDNCKYCKKPGHSVEKCWKLQAKKHQ